jgi:CheY-like chemotaxis protein
MAATVLVVDDDTEIRDALRLLLEEAEYEVLEAANGLQAIEALRAASRPMVVLLDLMMPLVDGAGVLGEVSADRVLSTRHAYILVTATQKTFTLAFASLLAQLQVRVISKPFDIDKLLAIVANAAARIT